MDDNLKATIMVCIFTLIVSISTAYGVLKIDSATSKQDIISLQEGHDRDITYLEKEIMGERSDITRLLEQQLENSNVTLNRLDEAMCKFTDRVNSVSNTMARLDERLKSIEAGR